MNCQNFEIIVNELARQQKMQADVREQALAHTSGCGPCAARLADERALTQQLRAMTIEMSEMEAPARIETELLAAFSKHKTTTELTVKHKFGSQFTRLRLAAAYDWRYWATAAAAVLLIVIGIAAMRSRPVPVAAENPYVPTIGPKVAENKSAAPDNLVDEPKPGSSAEQGILTASHNPKRHGNVPPKRSNSAGTRNESKASIADENRTVAGNHGMNEIATDFMPVGYTSPMDLQDGGQVMRVELPRSTLAGFGLPVNMDRVNERVKADVLVGPDGQARAIRFVQ